MKRYLPFVLILCVLSLISGFLMSKASLVGRVGISLFYHQYKFLKIWWQGALVVFLVLMAVLLIQYLFHRYFTSRTANVVYIIFIFGAMAGLYFTYLDFRHTLSHRFLGERFHLGAYLFWVCAILISLFFLFARSAYKPTSTFKSAGA